MKILLPVMTGPSMEDPLRLAVDTALALGAEILGLFVADAAGIARSEAGAPPGAIRLAREAAGQILRRTVSEGENAVKEAASACREAGVPFSGEVREGDPREEIEAAAARCDLLVSCPSSRFSYGGGDAPGRLVSSLVKERILPVLLSAEPHRPVRTAVIGCGGGARTARAVGSMARLGLWKRDARIVLLAVDDSPDGGEARLSGPRQTLSEAGYPSWEERIIAPPKLERFVSACEEVRADAVVLGGWGEHRLDDLLGLSLTGRLLSERRFSLFLYM